MLLESWLEEEHKKKTGKEIKLPGHPERRQLVWVCGCRVNRPMIQGVCYTCGKMSDGSDIEE
jgi:hypothetical protein